MNYKEFRRHIGKAALSVNSFASIIGVLPNAVSNYSKKQYVPNEYAVIAVLMGDAADRGVDFMAVLNKFGIYEQISIDKKVSSINKYKTKT